MEPFNHKYYILEMVVGLMGRRVKSAPTDTDLLITTRVVRKHPVSVDSWYIPGFSNLTTVQMSSQYSTSSSEHKQKKLLCGRSKPHWWDSNYSTDLAWHGRRGLTWHSHPHYIINI